MGKVSGKIACPCCGEGAVLSRVMALVKKLAEMGAIDIIITSGYRCEKHNSSLRFSSPKSQHMVGLAVDIFSYQLSPIDLALIARDLNEADEMGIGIYATHCHIDLRGKKARWAYYPDGTPCKFDEAIEYYAGPEWV